MTYDAEREKSWLILNEREFWRIASSDGYSGACLDAVGVSRVLRIMMANNRVHSENHTLTKELTAAQERIKELEDIDNSPSINWELGRQEAEKERREELYANCGEAIILKLLKCYNAPAIIRKVKVLTNK